MSEEHVEVIVVGTGVAGLGAAKSYIHVQPGINMIVLERFSSVGGVWASERLYAGLNTNDFLGTYEFPDFPLKDDRVKEGEHIPAVVLHDYMEAYAKRFDIFRRIRFDTVVSSIERLDDGWRVNILNAASIRCDKLMIATGMTSDPFIPKLPGRENFDAPLLHSCDLAKRGPELLKTAKSVVVLGSQKSAYDSVYMFATAGVKVDWIIRQSGHGPGWMVSSKLGPLTVRVDKMIFMRAANCLSPCIWEEDGRVRNFLHKTAFGRSIVDGIWKMSAHSLTNAAGWGSHPETAKLKPWVNPFWAAASVSAFNYPTDMLELVRSGMAKVHIADIATLSSKTVQLSTGEFLSTDALIAATGWEHVPSIKFLPEGIERDLGIPYLSTEPDPAIEEADKEIFQRFPRLAEQPIINPDLKKMSDVEETRQPFRLYRFTVPPSDKFGRSITFHGMLHAPSHCLWSEIQGLWAVAYLTGRMQLPSEADRARDALLVSRWLVWRYPAGYGRQVPDYAMDSLPRLDQLMRDLGLDPRRKKGTFSEMFSPYRPWDYKGIVDEWRAKQTV